MDNSTIAAIATPVAGGGVGVLRLSGPRSKEILFQVFRRYPCSGIMEAVTTPTSLTIENMRSHRFYHGYIVDNDRLVDEVLVVFMQEPRSYTGEDVVEIHAHSGPVVLTTILQLLVHSGAMLAQPGEFTRRAFLNGKMDLTQAEAVAEIIDARSVKALQAATNQVAGKLNQEIGSIKDIIAGVLAEIEASIDFSDQGDEPLSLASIGQRLRSVVLDRLQRLIDDHEAYSLIKTGMRVALVGSPNVGKSTLLNTILGRERAIVSVTPGTTRDFIEEPVLLNGCAFVFADTAGLRSEAGDDVERIGMTRTHELLSRADTILFMIDAAAGVLEEDRKAMAGIQSENMIMVANKMDLPPARRFSFPPEWDTMFPVIKISALTGEGIDALNSLLVDQYQMKCGQKEENPLIPNLRHKIALEETIQSVWSAITAIENNLTEELVALDLREAIEALNRITGHNAGIDVLDEIFSRFCIGK